MCDEVMWYMQMSVLHTVFVFCSPIFSAVHDLPTYVRTYVHPCALHCSTYVHMYMHMNMYVCMFVTTYVHMHACTYVYG